MSSSVASPPPVLVLEVGSRWTRFGVAGHPHPRVVVRTPGSLSRAMKGKLNPRPGNVFIPFLRNVVFAHDTVHSATVYYVTNVDDNARWVRFVREVVTKAFFAAACVVVPLPVAAVHIGSRRSGVVIDIGADSVRCTTVVHGVPFPNTLYATETLPAGTDAVTVAFVRQLKAKYAPEARKALDADLGEGIVIENAMVRWMHVAKKGEAGNNVRDVKLRHTTTSVDPSLAAEILFDDVNEEDFTLPHALLRAVLRADCVSRRDVASNIVICGGGASFPGLKHRLAQEVSHLLAKDSQYASLQPVRGNIALYCGATEPNLSAYLGCATVVSPISKSMKRK